MKAKEELKILREDHKRVLKENHALLHRAAEAEKKIRAIKSADAKKLYDDLHDPDRRAFWKSVVEGIDEEAARKWAFERLNRRLIDLLNISPENSHAFYVNQGAIAELNNFLNLHKLAAGYLKEDLPPAQTEGKEEEKPISKEFE